MPIRARHHRRLGIARYAAIWHMVTGLAWAVRHGLTAAEYQQALNELVAKGFRLKMVSGTGILVNKMSIGPYPQVDEQLDIDWTSLCLGMVVADESPNPPRTLCSEPPKPPAAPCVLDGAYRSTWGCVIVQEGRS